MEGIQCICPDTFVVLKISCQNCSWRGETLAPGRWACDAHGPVWDEKIQEWVWPSQALLERYQVWCPECGYQAVVSY